MKTFLLALVLTIAVAASLTVILDRFAGPGARRDERLAAIEDRLEQLSAAMAERSPGPASPKAPAEDGTKMPPPGTRTLSDVVELLTELEGMVLDLERRLRQDLVGVFEKLDTRLSEVQAPAAPAGNRAEDREKLHAKLAEMGARIEPESGMVELAGEASETTRALELLAVAPGGRAYEAMYLVDVTPSALKIALEDLGLTESEPDPKEWTFGEEASGAYVYVLWEGLKKPRRVEDTVLNVETNETMERTKWMFTASRFFTDTRTWERHFAADLYKNLIAISFNYTVEAILACPLPAAANQNIFVPHPDFAPRPGTKVRMFVRTEPHPEWDAL